MEQNDKLKDAKRSVNARLLLLAVGIMLVVNGVISSGRTGLSWLSLANLVTEAQMKQADTGTDGKAETAPAEEARDAGDTAKKTATAVTEEETDAKESKDSEKAR